MSVASSVAAAWLAACGGIASDPAAQLSLAPLNDPAWRAYRERALAAAGRAAASAAAAGAADPNGGAERYVVEWDLVFASEDALRDHYMREVLGLTPKLATFAQESTGFEATFGREAARDITYCVSNGFSNKPTVVADMALATRAWEDAADVQFRHVPEQDATCDRSNTVVAFSVLPTRSFLYTACAVNRLIWQNGPRCFVSINPVVGVLQIDYERIPGQAPDDAQTPTGVLQHELGHILGFRHEHAWAPQQGGCDEAPSIPRNDLGARRLTDVYDPDGWDQDSVMQYPRCNGRPGADFALSELDRTGARSVYGMPRRWYPAALIPLGQ